MNGRYLLFPLPAMALAASLVAAFPFDVIRLPPSEMPAASSGCAIVSLTPAEERQALAAARSAWKLDRGRTARIKLYANELPEMPPREVVGLQPSSAATPLVIPAGCRCDMLPVSLAAPPPSVLPKSTTSEPTVPPFPRDELLRIN